MECSTMILRVAIWSLHDLPFRKPAWFSLSFFSPLPQPLQPPFLFHKLYWLPPFVLEFCSFFLCFFFTLLLLFSVFLLTTMACRLFSTSPTLLNRSPSICFSGSSNAHPLVFCPLLAGLGTCSVGWFVKVQLFLCPGRAGF